MTFQSADTVTTELALPLVRISRVSAPDVLDLRAQVLRDGGSLESARYTRDDLPTTVHLAAHDLAGAVVGVVTCQHAARSVRCPAPVPLSEVAPGQVQRWPDIREPAWQMRGMAVADRWRSKGVGRLLLNAALRIAQSEGITELWAHARVTALDFYRREGFEVVSGVFHLTWGPHVVVVRPVTPPDA